MAPAAVSTDIAREYGSVRELSGMKEVPSIFKKESLEESFISAGQRSIPVIDLAELEGDGRASVLEEIRCATEEWGFFQVVNHGVPLALLEDVLWANKQFFELPREEKLKYWTAEPSKVTYGSGSTIKRGLQPWRDYLTLECSPAPEMEKWPTEPLTFKDISLEYNKLVKLLSDKLLCALSESLGISSDFLRLAATGVRLTLANYYPPCPQPEAVHGIPAHSDPLLLTILLQDETGGLEVRDKHGGWVQIQPLPHALVINMGDQMEILTNGQYKSVEHRVVVNSEKARMSLGTFFSPLATARIAPASELVARDGASYREIIFEDYMTKFRTTGTDGKRHVEKMKIFKPSSPVPG